MTDSTKGRARCRMRLVSAMALAIMALPPAARAQEFIPVDIPWSVTGPGISRPERLELGGNGPAVRIDYDPRSGHFVGRYPRDSDTPSFDNLSLVGWWNGQEDRLLFLRISPTTDGLHLRLWRPAYSVCRQALISPLQQLTYDRGAALEAYYRAKALFELDNRSRCRGDRRIAVARAWFDRSFELVRIDCAFRLSPDAARAYRQFNAPYVASLSGRAQAREIACANQAKDRLWRQGDLRSAYSINLALVRSLTNDPRLRALTRRWQGLDLELLQRDGERIVELLRPNPARQPGTFQPATLNLSTGSAN